MESNQINEFLLTAMVIKRAIQIANAKNIDAKEDAPRVKAKDLIEEAVSELKEMRPVVMKFLSQT